MTERYPRASAYHEAGHVVVAWSLGLPVGAVSVSEDDASGNTQIGLADHLTLIEQIAVCYGRQSVCLITCYDGQSNRPKQQERDRPNKARIK